MIALSVLSIGLLAHGLLTVNSLTQSGLNRERRLALEGLRSQLEVMRSWDFSECFQAFDPSTSNDPPGAPGARFDVLGLEPTRPGDRVGSIVFPVGPDLLGSTDPVLREDLADPALGLPADLDGDGSIDNLPKNERYVRIPVILEAKWQGVRGEHSVRVATWLGETR